jgi:hypothetical protein
MKIIVTVQVDGGEVLHAEERRAFNAGIRASEAAVRKMARERHLIYSGGRPTREGDVYRREWVANDARFKMLVATVERVDG